MRPKVMIAATAIALIVSGCSADSVQDSKTEDLPVVTTAYPGPLGKGEGKLNILAWPGYAENGGTDPAIDWVTPFEEETGCITNIRLLGSSDEAVKLIQAGGWDVVSMSGDSSLRLVLDGDAQPINTELLTNYEDLAPDLIQQPWNSWDGRVYGVPHGRAANVLVYNTDVVKDTPDSWNLVFDPGSQVAGNISAYDSPISIADAAVYLMSAEPELGITNPYALDQNQFDAAIAVLEQQRGLTSNYWIDPASQIRDFTEGITLASASWQSIAEALTATDVPVATAKPREGATGWSDSWMIATNATNINCSYLWLDWITSPEVNAQATQFFGEAPSNPKACEFMADPDHCEKFHAVDSSYWQDVYFWTTPLEQCIDGRTDVRCVPYEEWARAWAELRR